MIHLPAGSTLVPWIDTVEWIILGYFILINSLYGLLIGSATLAMRKHRKQVKWESLGRVLSSPVAPTITLLAPAHNEEATIESSVKAFLSLRYPNLEVVVVNDGSSDRTLDVLKDRFHLVPIHTIYWNRLSTQTVRGLYRSSRYPHLLVMDKENGGKADALNAGLNLAGGDLVCAVDADTVIEPDALQRMVRPFLMSTEVLAVGGTIRVANGSRMEGGYITDTGVPRRFLPGIQTVEYLRAFLFGRLGWNFLGGNLVISGAFGLFRRQAVVATGGYDLRTVGEDMELVLRLRRLGYESGSAHRVDFIPDPVAWTEAPETVGTLGRQRDRWHRGLAEALSRNCRMFMNPRYGLLGMLVFPYFLIVELLAPIIEATGIGILAVAVPIGIVSWRFALLIFLGAYGYALILTLITLVLEEVTYHRYEGAGNRAYLVLWALCENLGYRQLTVIWRLRGLTRWLMRRRDWGHMERRGFRRPVPSEL